MRKESENLMRLLKGERVYNPPFWEVWFAMWEFFKRRYGDYVKIEDRIKMAEELNMAAIPLGGIPIGLSFTKSEETSSGEKRYAGGLLENMEHLEKIPLPDWSELKEGYKKSQEVIKNKGFVSWITLLWCFHGIATSMGLENFCYKLYDDYEFIDNAFEWIEERNRKAIKEVISYVKPDFVLFDGDCAYKTGLMVRPEIFRKLVYKKTEKTVSLLKELDIPYTFHTDGKLDDVIPILIELGFSAVHGCEKQANDLEYLVEKFGDDIVLVGNMDVVFLSQAKPEEVERETLKMLETGSKKGKFVAACNTSPQDYIPEENYLTFVETIKKFRR
ncbi:hypothetical protein J7L87_04555 [bacterium]|nr:hypothetical protein [bacterium]